MEKSQMQMKKRRQKTAVVGSRKGAK